MRGEDERSDCKSSKYSVLVRTFHSHRDLVDDVATLARRQDEISKFATRAEREQNTTVYYTVEFAHSMKWSLVLLFSDWGIR
jgi:hypothetical protein